MAGQPISKQWWLVSLGHGSQNCRKSCDLSLVQRPPGVRLIDQVEENLYHLCINNDIRTISVPSDIKSEQCYLEYIKEWTVLRNANVPSICFLVQSKYGMICSEMRWSAKKPSKFGCNIPFSSPDISLGHRKELRRHCRFIFLRFISS